MPSKKRTSSNRKKRSTTIKKKNDKSNNMKQRPTNKPTAWMDTTIRNWLIALRPWSFPASLLPIALAGTILYQDKTVETLYTGSFILCFLIVLSLHAAANLTNTYYDFKHGVDVKESGENVVRPAVADAPGPPAYIMCHVECIPKHFLTLS